MGLILVFDLDQTLIDTTRVISEARNDIVSNLNYQLINEVLKPALEVKGRGVDAILMLSNNSSEQYARAVEAAIVRVLGLDADQRVFDYLMMKDHPARILGANPPKRLEDVEFMVSHMGVTWSFIDDLVRRIYFFDDKRNHEIRADLPEGHYIQIHPDPSTTDYSHVKAAILKAADVPLLSLGGSHCTTRRNQRRSHRTRKLNKKLKSRRGSRVAYNGSTSCAVNSGERGLSRRKKSSHDRRRV